MKNNTKFLIDKFLDFEARHYLFQKSLSGVKFWHLIRFQVFESITKKENKLGPVQRFNSNIIINSINALITLLKTKSLFSKNPFFVNRKSEILISNHSRRVKNGHYYECLYTDLLIEHLNFSHTTIESPYNHKHFLPIKNKNILYLDLVNLWISFRTIFSKFRFTANETRYLKDLYINIENNFEIDLSSLQFESLVKKNLYKFTKYDKFFRRLLNDVKPRVILQVVSYSIKNMALNNAAKDFLIPTVEFQHGTMGYYHIAYNFRLKGLHTFPDYIFTFGNYWNNHTKLPISNENVISVGWPYLEQKVSKYKFNKKISAKKVILFISQGTIGHALSKIALELHELLELNEFEIIYKLHPGEYFQWEKNYPLLRKSNLQVIDNNLKDLHHFLSMSEYQVGVSSTAIFEGLAYGLKTIVINLPEFELMNDLIKQGHAKLAHNANDINLLINENIFRTIKDFNDFWEANSLDKMVDAINRISKLPD